MRLPGAPGKHPHITSDNVVVSDIERWESQMSVPPAKGLDWSKAKQEVADLDRNETFVVFWSAQGLFERSHFLMGMEEAFCAYLEEPEAMGAMLEKIADFKIAAIEEAYKQIHPDVVYFHDDWGSKQNLFPAARRVARDDQAAAGKDCGCGASTWHDVHTPRRLHLRAHRGGTWWR